MRCRDANCVKPPAMASASRTVVAALSSYRAGLATSPITETLKLRTSVRVTETSGLGMYSPSFLVRRSRSSIGVRPAASTSFTSGSDTMPSGRTGTVRLMASFFHTEICSVSSGPMRNRCTRPCSSCGLADASAARTGATETPGARLRATSMVISCARLMTSTTPGDPGGW